MHRRDTRARHFVFALTLVLAGLLGGYDDTTSRDTQASEAAKTVPFCRRDLDVDVATRALSGGSVLAFGQMEKAGSVYALLGEPILRMLISGRPAWLPAPFRWRRTSSCNLCIPVLFRLTAPPAGSSATEGARPSRATHTEVCRQVKAGISRPRQRGVERIRLAALMRIS